MRETLVPILCCPACKAKVTWQKSVAVGIGAEGKVVCEKCRAEYGIHNGVPRLYVGDDETIARSDQSRHADFILDRKHLEERAQKITPSSVEPKERMAYKRIPALAMAGWLLLLAGFAVLVAGKLNFDFPSELSAAAWIAVAFSFVLFAIDFWLYRAGLNQRERYQLHRLTELSKAARLSEFDLHTQKGHQVEDEGDPFEDKTKADEIALRLERYKTNGTKGLNVGCGGDLHRLVSKPYFDRGLDMLGVDISEGYILQYQKLFGTDGVLANALALPFENATFSIANYCDVLEHVHHPYLGLSEVNRVLKPGGLLIASTNYRCRLSRECANPLILMERVVSLYFDSILGPRDRLRGFGDMEFYHLDFSKRELTDLFESAGFEIAEFYTYLSKRKSLTNLFSKLPILRYMGDAILIVGRKKSESPRA